MLSRQQSPPAVFPVPRTGADRLRFRIGAKDVEALCAVAIEICARHPEAQTRMKICRLHSSCTGLQTTRLPIYRNLRDVFPVDGTAINSFIVGHLGEADQQFFRMVLEAVRARGGLVDLEERVDAWLFGNNGAVLAEIQHKPLAFDVQTYAEFVPQLCTNIPPQQLYLGFSLPKVPGEPVPLRLTKLTRICDVGFQKGGWFILQHPDQWIFRSTEFSYSSLSEAKSRLANQARTLRQVLGEQGFACMVTGSLESVHGIWTSAP